MESTTLKWNGDVDFTDNYEDVVKENIPRCLTGIRQSLVTFVQRITRFRRTPASHILIFMISPEEHNRKPYAIPVQCIPYKSLSDSKVRELANNVIREMVKRNMKVAGIYNYVLAYF